MNNMYNLNRLNTETSNLNVEDVEDGRDNNIIAHRLLHKSISQVSVHIAGSD